MFTGKITKQNHCHIYKTAAKLYIDAYKNLFRKL